MHPQESRRAQLTRSLTVRVVNPLTAPIELTTELGSRVMRDLDSMAEIARSVPRVITLLESLDKRAGQVLELGERIDSRAEAILELGQRSTRRAEAIITLGGTIDERGAELVALGDPFNEIGTQMLKRRGSSTSVRPRSSRRQTKWSPSCRPSSARSRSASRWRERSSASHESWTVCRAQAIAPKVGIARISSGSTVVVEAPSRRADSNR